MSLLPARGDAPGARLNAQDWDGIREAHEAWKLHFQPTKEGHVALNDAQGWRSHFDARGMTTVPEHGGWRWGLELRAYGFEGQERHLAEDLAPAVTLEGARFTRDWSGGLEEWYVNRRNGLEHGFTVRERPSGQSGSEPLGFELAVRGGLAAQVRADGQAVGFADQDGRVVLTYDALKVWDADGRILPARMMGSSTGLRLEVDELGARYPLTIDPTARHSYLKGSNTETGDYFGQAVAVDGDTVVIGAHQEDSSFSGGPQDNTEPSSGAVYVFVRDGADWNQQAMLKASNAESFDYFGCAVAISGDTLVVGAYQEAATAGGGPSNNGAPAAGAAYVFVRSAGSWTQQAYLKASNAEPFDHYGRSVAISGNTVVVGAPQEDASVEGGPATNNRVNSGAAYVYFRSGVTWSEQAYLKAANADVNDNFGQAVAISGDTVVAGVEKEDASLSGGEESNDLVDSGAVYVFIRSGVNWSPQSYLKASNAGAADLFGQSVAIEGNTLVVGAPQEDSGAAVGPEDNGTSNAGAAYVFTRSGSSWTEQAILKAGNADAGDGFGGAVALSGSTLLVGAPGEDGSGTGVGPTNNNGATDSGAAYLFTLASGNWTQTAYLKASNTGGAASGRRGDAFGHSLGISGDNIVSGAPREASTFAAGPDDNAAPEAGAAYLFNVKDPNIRVIGYGRVIETADTTPSSLDGTDLGGVPAVGGTVVRHFSIQNTGALYLTLTGTSPNFVTLTGTGASAFTVSSQPAGNYIAPVNGSVNFSISFDPDAEAAYNATVNIANSDSSKPNYTFAIRGDGTNTPPVITSNGGADDAAVSVAENTTAVTTVQASDVDQGQTLRYKIQGGADAARFGINATSGALVFKAAPNFEVPTDANGDNQYEVVVAATDNGKTPMTGTQNVVVTVTNVNEVPTFVRGANQNHPLGHAAVHTVPQWATSISDGDALNTQVLDFTVTVVSGAEIFDVPPDLDDTDGTLTYTTNGIAGKATVSVTLTDDASLPGAALTSAPQLFTVFTEVTPALDKKPPVVKITVPSAKTKSVPGVFNIAGNVTDSYGIASVVVKVNGVTYPLAAPIVVVPGKASAWSVPNVPAENGPNRIDVEATDLVGRVARTAKVVNYANVRPELAGVYIARIEPDATVGNDTAGLISLNVTQTGTFSGRLYLGGTTPAVTGVLRNDGTARFLKALGDTIEFRAGKGATLRSLGFLALKVEDPAGLTGTLSDQASGGAQIAHFAALKAPYSKTNTVPAELLNVPVTGTATKGVYNTALASKLQSPGTGLDLYPQGDGPVVLSLSREGIISLSGFLADGSKYAASTRLRSDGTAALFTSLYGKAGGIGGEVAFVNLPDSDVTGSDLLWIRPALPKSAIYKAGWPTGVKTDLLGTFYALPVSLDFGQGAIDAVAGNANLVFEDGLLASPVTHAVSVDPLTGRIAKIAANNPDYTLGLTAKSGLFSGKFRHDNGALTVYRGILLNKGLNKGGFGYFIRAGADGQSGGVSLDPDGP